VSRGRPLVLVPGACLGGWAWQDVARRLRELGHDVYPVTLTGLGDRVHLARPDVDLDTHIEDVVSVLDHEGLETGMFGSAAGLEDEHYRLLEERGSAQPYATFTTPLRLTGGAPIRRRAAIFSADGGMSVETLRELMEQGDPRAATFADPEWELHDLPTGHWAMFSAPGPLADVLHEVAGSA
jgi:hypothetical protein